VFLFNDDPTLLKDICPLNSTQIPSDTRPHALRTFYCQQQAAKNQENICHRKFDYFEIFEIRYEYHKPYI
jgi:hypothetical protein